MSPRHVRMAVALLAALPLLGAPTARADEQVVATVYAAGGAPQSDAVSVGQLSGCPTYSGPADIEQYQGNGSASPAQPVSQQAWTVAAVLGCLPTPIPSSTVTGVTVIDYAGHPETDPGAELSPTDLEPDSPSWVNPAEAPVIFSDGTNLNYERPWRGGSDANAPDQVTTDGTLALDVFTGPLLTVSVQPSAEQVAPGQSVSFSATVSGSGSSQLSYSWDFGDGQPGSASATPSVTFADAGTYEVSVEVTDSDGGGGGASTRITVGQSAATRTSTTNASGPVHGGGPTLRAGAGHRHGTSPGGQRSTPRPSASGAASSTSAPVKTTGTASPTKTSSRAAPAPVRTHPAARPVPRTSGETRRPAPARRRQAGGAPVSAPPKPISGRLLGTLHPLPAEALPAAKLTRGRPAAPAEAATAPVSALGAIAAVGLVVALMVCGGLGELRGRRAVPGSGS